MRVRDAVLFAIVLLVAPILVVIYNPAYWVILIYAFILNSIVLVFWLVRRHARVTVYICPECKHEFQVSAMRDFLSPHTMHSKRLTCPECGKKNWCSVL
ncbi:MAG: hypothetical protein R3F48_01685 [Candidatus Zixiibacteriota bacterium]